MPTDTILVVNDDGIGSKGLWTLVEVAKSFGEVFVVAPRIGRSGIGKGITIGDINVKKYMSEDILVYSIDGTPADAVLLGLEYLLPREPDIVLSGVNLGPNLGIEDFLDSGTIGAAIEAAIHEKLGVAFSLAIPKRLLGQEGPFLARTKQVISKILASIVSNLDAFTTDHLISVNVPCPPTDQILPSRISRKAMRSIHRRKKGGYSMKPWDLTLYPADEEGTDIYVVRELNAISISVVNLNLYDNIEKARLIINSISDSI